MDHAKMCEKSQKNDKFCNTNKSGDKNQVVYRENDYCTTCQFKDVMRLFVEDLANIILTKLGSN